MFLNAKISELLTSIVNIAPVSQGVGSAVSGWIPVKNYLNFVAIISTGVLGTAATVDAKVQQATSSGGAGAKDITGKAITQIVKATGDGKQAIINFRPQDLDTNGGFTHVQLSVTVAAAASLISAEILGASRFMPANDLNPAAVVQIV
ncbi:MAG: hypothetical protein WC778_11000 [Negativicutes bacterium]|jgi:hypothetical protein